MLITQEILGLFFIPRGIFETFLFERLFKQSGKCNLKTSLFQVIEKFLMAIFKWAILFYLLPRRKASSFIFIEELDKKAANIVPLC